MEENHLHCRTEVNGDEDRRKVALITGITGTIFTIFTIFTMLLSYLSAKLLQMDVVVSKDH